VAELLRDGADQRARDGAGRQAIDLATDPAIRALLASRLGQRAMLPRADSIAVGARPSSRSVTLESTMNGRFHW
jgi:hypothetical protein